MSGEWEKRESLANPHKCDLPDLLTADAAPGSVWRCECGQRWEVVLKNPFAHLGRAFTTNPRPLSPEDLGWSWSESEEGEHPGEIGTSLVP